MVISIAMGKIEITLKKIFQLEGFCKLINYWEAGKKCQSSFSEGKFDFLYSFSHMIEVSLLVKFVSRAIFRYYYTFFQSGIQHLVNPKYCLFPHYLG